MATKVKVHARTIGAAAAMASAALIAVAPTASAAAETPGQAVGNELRSGITTLVQPLVPTIESVFGYPQVFLASGPYPLPSVTNSAITW